MTVHHLADLMRPLRAAGMSANTERIGGNVWAVITDDEVTVTINGGLVAWSDPADVLICRDGAELLTATIHQPNEIVPLVVSATAPRWSDQSAALTGLVATETPTERKILANFLLAAGWADAVGSDGKQVTASIDADDITADDATWVAVRTMIRDFLARLDPLDVDSAKMAAARAAAREIVYNDPEQAGHDLWLSMRGHGAGFWDRGHGEVGDLLHQFAIDHGSEDAHVEVDMPAADFDALTPSDALPTITLHYPL